MRPGPWWQPWARALRRPAPPVPKGGEVRHLTRRIRRNGGTSRPPFSADNKKAVSLSKKDTATAHGPFRGNCTLLKREEVSCAPYAGRRPNALPAFPELSPQWPIGDHFANTATALCGILTRLPSLGSAKHLRTTYDSVVSLAYFYYTGLPPLLSRGGWGPMGNRKRVPALGRGPVGPVTASRQGTRYRRTWRSRGC